MGCYQYVYGRRVWAKRVASVCGVIVLVGVAGCSSATDRMGYYGSSDRYATASLPVPPEPVYGRGNGYADASYQRGEYADYGGSRRAPFATASYSSNETSSVQRSNLTPVNGGGSRYAANDAPMPDGGYAYAMQTPSSGGSSGKSNGYGNGGGNYASDRQPVPVDDFRSQYRNYDNDGRYGAPRSQGAQYATGATQGGGGDYVVQQGDTVYSIAQRFRMTTAELSELNGLRGADIHPGQRLRVGGQTGYTASNAPAWQGNGAYGNSGYNNSRSASSANNYGYTPPRGYGDERYGNAAGDRTNTAYRGYQDQRNQDNRRAYASNQRDDDDRAQGRQQPQYGKAPAPEYSGVGSRNARRDAIAYSVKRGDTVFDIARRNGISHRELADYNDISTTAKLYPGQMLHIPRGKGYDWGAERGQTQEPQVASRRGGQPGERGGDRAVASNAPSKVTTASAQKPSKPVAVAEVRANQPEITGGPGARTAMVGPGPSESAQVVAERHDEAPAENSRLAPRECEAMLANPSPRSAKNFREPVSGAIIAKFGPKEDGSFNDGVNFSVPKGTPVKAAENGVVAYAGDELSGFGNLVLIRHADGYVTAYAHNDELAVKRCDVVKRGQTIGKAGASGNATKPQLHFELRKDSKPVDPEAFFSRS